jgi:hypothetical protein
MDRREEPDSVWQSVTKTSAEDPPLPDDPDEDEEYRCHDRRPPRLTPIATTALGFKVRLDSEGVRKLQITG